MSRTVLLRSAVVLLLVGLVAVPAAAVPFCANCTCNHKCTTRCFDGVGFDVCGNYLCQGMCPIELQPRLDAELFGAEPAACSTDVPAPAGEIPADGER